MSRRLLGRASLQPRSTWVSLGILKLFRVTHLPQCVAGCSWADEGGSHQIKAVRLHPLAEVALCFAFDHTSGYWAILKHLLGCYLVGLGRPAGFSPSSRHLQVVGSSKRQFGCWLVGNSSSMEYKAGSYWLKIRKQKLENTKRNLLAQLHRADLSAYSGVAWQLKEREEK